MAAKLYDILCFYCYVGNWTDITPVDIINLKGELNKDMNLYSQLFSEEISSKYEDFIQLCFISSSGWEHDTKIKSLYELRQKHNVKWDDGWIEYFDPKNVIEAVKMRERYNEKRPFRCVMETTSLSKRVRQNCRNAHKISLRVSYYLFLKNLKRLQ